ncbi:hypothetical protein QNH14_02745 [Apirhabdus apintestini]|nr:hypothetical protein QNH14_02745 [Enterobacteriaceae bacterium CA-0114]
MSSSVTQQFTHRVLRTFLIAAGFIERARFFGVVRPFYTLSQERLCTVIPTI